MTAVLESQQHLVISGTVDTRRGADIELDARVPIAQLADSVARLMEGLAPEPLRSRSSGGDPPT